MNGTTQQNHGRTSLIVAIKTPLSFFVLVLLVGESCLLLIAKDASGIDRTIAIIGMIGMLIFACVAVYSLAFQGSAVNDQFSHQLEGEWWEKINHSQGSQLSFFTITRNLLGDVVLEGTSYDRDGYACAKWKSEMTKLLPNERRLVYLWRGKHPVAGFAHLNFHGYGTMEFNPIHESFTHYERGSGDFWDVDEAVPENTIFKPVELRRVSSMNDKEIMTTGTDKEKRYVVMETIKEW